ncbi:hypothetical protein ACJX0J_020844 [Zea mays]
MTPRWKDDSHTGTVKKRDWEDNFGGTILWHNHTKLKIDLWGFGHRLPSSIDILLKQAGVFDFNGYIIHVNELLLQKFQELIFSLGEETNIGLKIKYIDVR